jgi:hypothetical protein
MHVANILMSTAQGKRDVSCCTPRDSRERSVVVVSDNFMY